VRPGGNAGPSGLARWKDHLRLAGTATTFLNIRLTSQSRNRYGLARDGIGPRPTPIFGNSCHQKGGSYATRHEEPYRRSNRLTPSAQITGELSANDISEKLCRSSKQKPKRKWKTCLCAYNHVYFLGVTAEARRALATIRECLEADNYSVSVHFAQRMDERGLFWPDIQSVIDDPAEVRSERMDDYGRPKWIVAGEAASLGEIEIVCAIECDDSGAVFITIYWED
jgi:hypothetical protein